MQPKTRKREIACPFYDPSIAFSGLFEKMESFAGLARVVLGEATRVKIRIKLLRREGDGPGGGKDVKCSIHQWRLEHSEEGGGGEREKKIEGTKVEASKSGSKMQTSWKIVKAKTLQM